VQARSVPPHNPRLATIRLLEHRAYPNTILTCARMRACSTPQSPGDVDKFTLSSEPVSRAARPIDR
jgi:hypothetical protein